MAQTQHSALFFKSFEDFLDWERHQEVRHDLVDGVPIAMAGGSEGHNIIQGNIYAALLSRLRGSPCRPFSSDMAMKTGDRKGRYPDVTVDCGPRNRENLSLPNPTVAFEILSPDTQGQDRTVKLGEYNDVETIAHYVLVEQDQHLAYIYNRGRTGDFLLRPQEVSGLEAAIELPAIGVSIPMTEVYDGIDLEMDPGAPPPTTSPWRR